MALPPTPKITWGASFVNTWVFPNAIDMPVPSFEIVGAAFRSNSGLRDQWITREDHLLSFIAGHVPKLAAYGATGLSDANGVYAALLWLAEGNLGRYFPDQGSGSFHNFELISHQIERQLPGGARYRISMTIRDTDGTAFTSAY